MTETAVKPKIEVTSFTEAHCAAVAEFFRKVWDPRATEESVRSGRHATIQSNPFQPGQEVPTILFLQNGIVLGYVSSIPVSLWNGGEEQPAFWVKGLMVLPEHRSGPVGYYLLQELLKRTPLALSLTVAPATRRLFQSLGFRELGMLTNHLRLLHPAAVARRLNLEQLGAGRLPNWLLKSMAAAQQIGLASAGAVAGCVVLNGFSVVRSRSTHGLEISFPEVWPDAAELNALWAQMRGSVLCGVVRDSRYLPWRYDISPSGKYSIAAARQRGKLVGLAVVRRPGEESDPRLNGIRVAVISEVLCVHFRPELLCAVLRSADILGAQSNADAILCSTSSDALRSAMRRAGFLRVPENLYFLWRASDAARRLSPELTNWWLTRGDMNADEVF